MTDCAMHVGPDCQTGKHAACDGSNTSAWCFERDTTTRCSCSCHAEPAAGPRLNHACEWYGFCETCTWRGNAYTGPLGQIDAQDECNDHQRQAHR